MFQPYKQTFENWFEKYRVVISLGLILFIVFCGTVLMAQGAGIEKNQNNVIKSEDPNQENKEAINQETNEVVFDIEGAVINPGVYQLPAGNVLVDAINKAGGLSIEADKERIAKEMNQASVISDNSKIYIFKISDKDAVIASMNANQIYSGSSIANSNSSSDLLEQKTGAKININEASLAELDTLSGIGPALAQRIIDWREANGGFEVLEDIKKVKGIGDSLFEKMKDLISVE